MTLKRNLMTECTKPWPKKSLPELGDFVASLGLDGVELPVRSGFQVTPEKAASDLPKAAKTPLQEHAVVIRRSALSRWMPRGTSKAGSRLRIARSLPPVRASVPVCGFDPRRPSSTPIAARRCSLLGLQATRRACAAGVRFAGTGLEPLEPALPGHSNAA